MTVDFVKPKHKRPRLRSAGIAIAGLAVLTTAGDHAVARGGPNERWNDLVNPRSGSEPVIAIVSLRSQRIAVYGASGPILRAPVSSGQKGRETPAGIFSVIQKAAEHYSNLYADGYMPHMQRITWSGIALHGGPLPGYPASHGCVRLPFEVAARLFDVSRLGMRVIVAPHDLEPFEITHPALFRPKADVGVLAAARAAEADEAARNADLARLSAVKAAREAARAIMPLRRAENLKRMADAELAAAEIALGSASSAEAKEQAEGAKAKAFATSAALQEQWMAAKAELQPKLDAVAHAREAAVDAETVRVAAVEMARQLERELEPVSVFISRKTQRLYVRRAFEPILESPVTILDADRPIGTHVFTAIERTTNDTNMRWSVVSVDGGRSHAGVAEHYGQAVRSRDVGPISTGPTNAIAALDRIVVPQDVLDRINSMASLRASLIISDEALSSETSKGTDFVVLLSGEPQGSLKIRRRATKTEIGRRRGRLPFANEHSPW